ncbi:MAG TPA: hypothetical protein VKB59_06105 [Micromonosporaceae bacterium]|nr:hypothetical protein [Micromonosporaceae bacterium]
MAELRVRSDLSALASYQTFPFDLPVQVRPLADTVAQEPPRHGLSAEDCHACASVDDDYIWTDESWRLRIWSESPLPGVVLLESRVHADSFLDLPPDLLTAFGPMCARVERALYGLGGIGRVHLYRWGDGGAHFHVWFYPRPYGRLQLRGSFITAWSPVLEPQPVEDLAAAGRVIAAGMRGESGSEA